MRKNKLYKIIGKYPIISVTSIAALIFIVGPIFLALIIACVIVVPIYLADQLFGDKE